MLFRSMAKVMSLFFQVSQEIPSSSIDLKKLFVDQYGQVGSSATFQPKSFFQGSSLESSFLPDSKPFKDILKRSRELKTSESSMMLALKKSYLPHRISDTSSSMRRKTSEESVSSVKGAPRANSRSRGAELMRLGSKNVEMRRGSCEETASNKITSNVGQKSLEESSRDQWKEKFSKSLGKEETKIGRAHV